MPDQDSQFSCGNLFWDIINSTPKKKKKIATSKGCEGFQLDSKCLPCHCVVRTALWFLFKERLNQTHNLTERFILDRKWLINLLKAFYLEN